MRTISCSLRLTWRAHRIRKNSSEVTAVFGICADIDPEILLTTTGKPDPASALPDAGELIVRIKLCAKEETKHCDAMQM